MSQIVKELTDLLIRYAGFTEDDCIKTIIPRGEDVDINLQSSVLGIKKTELANYCLEHMVNWNQSQYETFVKSLDKSV